MSLRRQSDTGMIQRIWDAIKTASHQRSLPSTERIIHHIASVHGITEKLAQEEIYKAVQDGLIVLKKIQSKNGVDQESYRLPLDFTDDDKHDWYCFKCHSSGVVERCDSCFRVYHSKCYIPTNNEKKLCQLCELINNDTQNNDIVSLNHILGFTCGHLKAKLPPGITNRTIVADSSAIKIPLGALSGPTWISEGEDAWRPGVLIKNHMDLAMMEVKTQRNQYKSLAEFQADAQNILHNIIVYHGENSVIGEMGVTMYEDCCYDLKEIHRCVDCYRISNEKSKKMWFCIPCSPPHQLVYAKQKGYPYWPAKVMEIKGDIYDVRFFGGHHLRANIERVFIKPINATLSSLQIKRSTAWNRAFEELKHHQNLLQKLTKYGIRCDSGDDDRSEPSKSRSVKSKCVKVVSSINVPPVKQIIKHLRVKVERLTSDGQSEAQLIPIKVNRNIDDNLYGATDANRQVPRLPVASDEPACEISGTCLQELRKEGSQEDTVTSSSQEPRSKCVLVQTDQVSTGTIPAKVEKERRTSEQSPTTALEKLRRELELDKCRELERLQAEHAKEMRQLTDKHQQVISEMKKKQWCYNCGAEAIYHCCWNTAYCSTDCQQIHWQREHKRICRRKR